MSEGFGSLQGQGNNVAHSLHRGGEDSPAVARSRRRTARLLTVGVLIALGGALAWGTLGHMRSGQQRAAVLDQRLNAVPEVHTLRLHANTAPRDIELPGTMHAFDATTLYARATGYIEKWNVDIGARVHGGDVLAVITAPDLDQQLAQARAQLVQSQAVLVQAGTNRDLARVTNSRTSRLVTEGWSSRQQGDNDRLSYASQVAGVSVAAANLKAQQAEVQRLEKLTGFEKVVAPFDGVITARTIDTGSLVTANAASGTSLYQLVRTDVLRVRVYVPQDYVFGVKDGAEARVEIPELPGKVFKGHVARNAHALQAVTRTLLIEVDVDNQDGLLTAGLYSVVHLESPRSAPVVTIPSEAVIFNSQGLSAVVMDENGQAKLVQLNVEADNGATLDIRGGLKDGDALIINPPIGVYDGMHLRMAGEKTAGRVQGEKG